MKSTFFTGLLLALCVSLSTSVGSVQGGNILSHFFHPRNNPNQHLQVPPPHNQFPNDQHTGQVPNLDWNSQIGTSNQQTMQRQVPSTNGPGCRTRDRVYLPDMQSFLIKTPLSYEEALQACAACGSELVLIDGTNIDRFREAFSSLGLFGDQRFWIKSWFGEQVQQQGTCPGTYINSLMGNRLEPIENDCQTRLFALCY